ncbi:MAG TPA: hypothetical protein VFA33_14820 [Bryobacteraceae bacterium]|nr:hypothetical protein [Bryobacteraceae bacterium]
MKTLRFSLIFLALLIAGACPWHDELREYLNAYFWLPFARHAANFEKPSVLRMNVPYAGMAAAQGNTALARLREAYQKISRPELYYQNPPPAPDLESLRQAVTAARNDQSLTRRDKEEVDLVAAKIEMRAGEFSDSDLLQSAERKFQTFLRTARTPEFRSEARGWLAHIHYLFGEQTAAGKIYLDELNRAGSNLSRETLLNSLRMTYGYDGEPGLVAHLDEYFDTPEHAAFAIELATNPHWQGELETGRFARSPNTAQTYRRIKDLLAKHEDLLRSKSGADTLGLLAMRSALSMGDPTGARKMAESVPATASVRASPDFQWMSASALFLSRDYAAAEKPLLALFRSPRATKLQRAAAAYGLCGVYWKTGNLAEQIRFALWLHTAGGREYLPVPSRLSDLSVYWAASGWDLNMLLDAEAPVDALRSFAEQNPNLDGIRLVEYSLAVRLSRQDRYQEAAELYRSIHANRRAQRLQRLALLSQAAEKPGVSSRQRLDARYELAEFVAANPEGIYFNDALWHGMQRYALQAASDCRLTRTERARLMDAERELKDSQDERWRAYLILRDIVHDAGVSNLGRDAAKLALRCLRGINTDRFGRQEEIRRADIDLSRWLQQASR